MFLELQTLVSRVYIHLSGHLAHILSLHFGSRQRLDPGDPKRIRHRSCPKEYTDQSGRQINDVMGTDEGVP